MSVLQRKEIYVTHFGTGQKGYLESKGSINYLLSTSCKTENNWH